MNTCTIGIKQVSPFAKTPKAMTEGSSGFDLYAAITRPIRLKPGEYAKITTGSILEIPRGFEGQIRPRSGLAANHGVTVLNSPGTIDSDYRGEVHVILINHGEYSYTVQKGDRIAQLVIAPLANIIFDLAAVVVKTERGESGFGSTGYN